MAKVEDCPDFETFDADVKAARKAKHLPCKMLAEMAGIEWRYLSNIENQGTIPNLPVLIQLVKVCGLPMEQYFNPETMREESEQRQWVSHKLKLCPEQYLSVIEGAIDGALKLEQTTRQKGGHIMSACFLRFFIKFTSIFLKVPCAFSEFLQLLSASILVHPPRPFS